MRYKVGNRIRVKSDLVRSLSKYGANSVTYDMLCMRGKVVTINGMNDTGYSINEFGFRWTDEMFEKAKPIKKKLNLRAF